MAKISALEQAIQNLQDERAIINHALAKLEAQRPAERTPLVRPHRPRKAKKGTEGGDL